MLFPPRHTRTQGGLLLGERIETVLRQSQNLSCLSACLSVAVPVSIRYRCGDPFAGASCRVQAQRIGHFCVTRERQIRLAGYIIPLVPYFIGNVHHRTFGTQRVTRHPPLLISRTFSQVSTALLRARSSCLFRAPASSRPRTQDTLTGFQR